MPVLNINEDEKKLLLIALVHDRVRLMHDWAQIGDDDGRIDPNGDRWVIDGVVDAVTDLRRKIENTPDEEFDIQGDAGAPLFKGAVWHHEHGWLYTVNQLQAAVEAAEAGGVSKAEVERILTIDTAFATVS